VKLADLVANPKNRWRILKANPMRVAALLRSNAESAPIVIDPDGVILDGIHRTATALARGREDIEVRLSKTGNGKAIPAVEKTEDAA